MAKAHAPKKARIHSHATDTLALAEKIKKNALKKKLASHKPDQADQASIVPEASEVSVSDGSKRFESFTELKLIPELLEAIQSMKFTKPTPIQAEAIPHA